MTKAVDRGAWVDLGLRMLAAGGNPSEVPNLDDAAEQLGVTKGSLYQHFPGKTKEWHLAVVALWEAGRQKEADRDVAQAGNFRDPLERLRILRGGAAASAVSDQSMRNWAAGAVAARPEPGAAAAAEALARVRGPVEAELAAALSDLGLGTVEAGVLTRVLVREFGLGPGDPAVPLGDDEGFSVLLEGISRAVRDDLLSATEVEVDADADGGSVVVIAVQSRTGAPVDRRALAEQARRFMRTQLAAPSAADAGAGEAAQVGRGSR